MNERRQNALPDSHRRDSARSKLLTSLPATSDSHASTRPFAWLEFAQMMSMLSSCSARPNASLPSPPTAPVCYSERRNACPNEKRPACRNAANMCAREENNRTSIPTRQSQLHQSTCRVVDKDESGLHCGGTILEPPVLGPVESDDSPTPIRSSYFKVSSDLA